MTNGKTPAQSAQTPSAAADHERRVFERLKAELQRAYAAPESAYVRLTATQVIARNRT